MKPATEILLSAAFVLTPVENWTTEVFARRASGQLSLTLQDDDIACFCARGALYAAGGMSHARHARPRAVITAETYLLRAAGLTDDDCFGSWNNTHTHAEVLDALYKAAELSEES